MKKFILPLWTAILTFFSFSALAHHPMGGKTPSNLAEGFISGLAHPVIGLDHFIFISAVGVAAVLIGQRVMMPVLFVIATLSGAGIHLQSFNLPMVETVIALSVIIVGWMILSGRNIPVKTYAALFMVSGLFHGFAYGEAIFGAEAAPLIAYLAGFGFVQICVALAAGYIVVELIGKGVKAVDNISARISGGMVAGAGMLIFGEQVITSVLG